jgi:PIN domain nuclease of toxin-antitoxin system
LTFVVDTSVLLAIAFDELGAEEAQRLARGGMLGMANLVETVTRGQEKGYPPETTLAFVSTLALEIVAIDRATADQAMALWMHRKPHLSLGDRLCIGLARARAMPVLTGDRVWKDLPLGVDVRLFR